MEEKKIAELQNKTQTDSDRKWTLQPNLNVDHSRNVEKEKTESVSKVFLYAMLLMFVIAIVGGILAGLNYLTSGIIKDNEAKEVDRALQTIFPDANEFENVLYELNDVSDLSGVSALYKAYDNGELLGYCTIVETEGFSNDGINMVVGSDTLNQIVMISVLESGETPGKGADLLEADSDFLTQFEGLGRPIEFTKSVTAVTGATTTSDGVLKGVNIALSAVDEARLNIDSTEGATNE